MSIEQNGSWKNEVLDLWAKKDSLSEHPLEFHLIDTASVCGSFLLHDLRVLRLISPTEQTDTNYVSLLRFLCSIHDIGKVSGIFQNQTESVGSYRHDLGGYYLLTESCFQTLLEGVHLTLSDRRSRRALFNILRTATMHHGSPKGCYDVDRYELLFKKEEVDYASLIITRMSHIYSVDASFLNDLLKSNDLSRITNIFAAIINHCDWIASGKYPFCSQSISIRDYKEQSEIRSEAIFSSDYLNICRKEVQGRDFATIFGFLPSPLQSAISEMESTSPAMIIVEDATGAGKTEASLYAAIRFLESSDLDGITFALPTRSTSNLMFRRLNGYASSLIYDSPSVSLQHSSSAYYLENMGMDTDSEWTFGRNKALFANISVCTVDQILSSVIPVRFQPLKLLAAVRHVVVIDEVHAYDAYTFGLLCQFVKYCKVYSTPVILLSATLPSMMKQQLISSYGLGTVEISMDFPLITICKDSVTQISTSVSDRSRREIKLRYTSDQRLLMEEMMELAAGGNRICWIRNTVDDAIEAFNSLPDGPYRKILLHSRFTLADRIDIEDGIFSLCGKGIEPSGLIVIGTQVIEQSLDIQFERVYSDLAPVDSLIQRMGRDQRFGDSPIECEFVVNGPEMTDHPDSDWYSSYLPRASYVYRDHSVLYNTAVLVGEGRIAIPSDYRRMIEFAYQDPDGDSPFFNNHLEFISIVRCSEALYKNIVLDPDSCYGCSSSEEFMDSQWDGIQRATTRQSDDRTVQCMLIFEEDGKLRPISGNPETSIVIVKSRYVTVDDCDLYDYGKWRFVRKLLVQRMVSTDGRVYWMNGRGIRYDNVRGLEYV